MHLSISSFREYRRETIFGAVFLGFLFLSALINGLFYLFIESKHVDVRRLEDRFFAQKVFEHEKNVDIVVLGDSRAYRGIMPAEILRFRPGENFLNFGFSGGGLNHEIFRFVEERKMGSGRKHIFIVGLTPYALTTEARKNDQFCSILKTPPEKIAEQLSYVPGRFTCGLFLKPFDAARIKVIRRALFRRTRHPMMEQSFYENGWCETRAGYDEKIVQRTCDDYIALFGRSKVDPRSQGELMVWTRKWTAMGHLVIGVRIPVDSRLLEIENSSSGFDEKGVRAEFRSAGGVYMDFSPDELRDYVCFDGSHLDLHSARKLSIRIGCLIDQELARRGD